MLQIQFTKVTHTLIFMSDFSVGNVLRFIVVWLTTYLFPIMYLILGLMHSLQFHFYCKQ